jgi:hypothetical protein
MHPAADTIPSPPPDFTRLDSLLDICRAHGAPADLARNLASIDPTEPELTYGYILGMVEKRIEHFGLIVDDPHALTRALWRAAC